VTVLEIVGVVALIWWAFCLIDTACWYAPWFRNTYQFFRLYGNDRREAAGKTVRAFFDVEPETLHGRKVREARRQGGGAS
jgi:hypothetical protein